MWWSCPLTPPWPLHFPASHRSLSFPLSWSSTFTSAFAFTTKVLLAPLCDGEVGDLRPTVGEPSSKRWGPRRSAMQTHTHMQTVDANFYTVANNPHQKQINCLNYIKKNNIHFIVYQSLMMACLSVFKINRHLPNKDHIILINHKYPGQHHAAPFPKMYKGWNNSGAKWWVFTSRGESKQTVKSV